jgi:hypothetical protein
MKIETSIQHRIQGTTLLVCLMASALIGIALAGYLTMNQQEYVNVIRSQTWNRTMAVTEAGTEEAMAMINKYANTATPLTSWTNSTGADGWTTLNNNVYYLRRYLGADYYDVYITNLNNSPAIKSAGTLAWTYMYASAAPQTMFAAAGASAPPPSTSRAVLIQTAPPKGYFLYGILAKKGISITGGGTNDSVNSLDPNYLANPWSQLLEHANGSIGTIESNVVAAFGQSSSTIFGHVNTGPGSTITVSGGSGGIGDTTWLPSNPGKIEPGWTNDTLNIAIPDPAPAPFAPYLSLPPIVNNAYVLTGLAGGGTAYYQAPAGINIGGGVMVLVTNGPVVLKCAGDFTLSGGSGISIANGASLTAYFTGKTTLSGGGVINGTGYATNCTFYGSPTCTSITYSGSSGFIGTVNAPEAAYTQSGGSGVIGALIVYSFTQSGGKSLMRYDEALGSPGGSGSVYRVVSWQEVKP